MKKRTASFLLIAFALILTACSSSGNWSRDIIGTWDAENISVGEHSNPLIAQLAAESSVRVVFEENGTFRHQIWRNDVLDNEVQGTYRFENLSSDHPTIVMERPSLTTQAQILESNNSRNQLRLSVTRNDTNGSHNWIYTKVN